jgi:hypothetical protein
MYILNDGNIIAYCYILYDDTYMAVFTTGEEGQECLKGCVWNSAWTNTHSKTKY